MARLFFALWPDEPARASLAALAARIAGQSGGRPVPAANLHLTLVFLGEVDPARVGELRRAVDGLSARTFTLELDCVGGFRRAGVAWAGCRQAPRELLALQADLDGRIRRSGFSPDERPFAPHLTVARRVREPPETRAIEPISWRAARIALVESMRGEGAYRSLAEWPLAPGAG